MSNEYKILKLANFEPFKWYCPKWGEPGRYVATIAFEWRDYPILLSVNQYVAGTTEGKYKMQVTLSHGAAALFKVKDMPSDDKKYIERAMKNSKRDVVRDILDYIFTQQE